CLLRAAGLAGVLVGLCELARADRAADDDGRDDEHEPACKHRLLVPRAPAADAGGDSSLASCTKHRDDSLSRSEDRDGAPVLWRKARRPAAAARWGGQGDEGGPPRRRMWGYPHRGRPGDPRPDSGLLPRARPLLRPGFQEHHVLPFRILEQTMNTIDEIIRRSSRRELAHRRSCGIDVRLMWDPAGNDLTVEVRDGDAPSALVAPV